MAAAGQRRVLVVGGGFAGLACGRDLATHFLVTIVDCKEFFEYTPGILRCYVKPKHFDALSFTLHPVIEQKMGCKFIWGEVRELKANRTAVIKPMFGVEETIDFDYCIVANGCNFGPFEATKGESLWFPTVHEIGRSVSEWKQFDERFIEGRRRHIFDEWATLGRLKDNSEPVLVTGAGFIGVEWATEIEHFFKGTQVGIMDMLPQPLGPLPDSAAKYCQKYMEKVGILQEYAIKKVSDSEYKRVKYDGRAQKFENGKPVEEDFSWEQMFDGKLQKPQNNGGKWVFGKEYSCIGVKASNYFVDKACLSKDGPGGGGWVLMDKTLSMSKFTGDEKVTVFESSGFSAAHEAELLGAYQKSGDKYTNGKNVSMCWDASEKKWFIDYKSDSCTVKLYQGNKCKNEKEPWHYGDMTFSGTLNIEKDATHAKGVTNKLVSVKAKAMEHWCTDEKGFSRVYCIGDANYGCYMGDGPPPAWPIPFIPKISYPGEEEGIVACRNIESTDALWYGEKENCWGTPVRIAEMHWPWGAGMFATSLGPNDACFVVSANWNKGSGWKVLWGSMSAVQKEIIEHSKVDECAFGFLGRAIWHFVHHTPVHLWGGGPRWGY